MMERLSERFMYYSGILASVCPAAVQDLKHIQNLIDLEEQGLLLKLPCKVGDTVYKLWYSNGIPYRIQELKIRTLENVVSIVKHNLLGERVFLTKEEAEAKLKEMQNEKV